MLFTTPINAKEFGELSGKFTNKCLCCKTWTSNRPIVRGWKWPQEPFKNLRSILQRWSNSWSTSAPLSTIRLESCEIKKNASQLEQQFFNRNSTENLTSFTFGPLLGKCSSSSQACSDFFHQFCQDETSLELWPPLPLAHLHTHTQSFPYSIALFL